MTISRQTADRITELTVKAVLRELEECEKNNTIPSLTCLSNAMKLLQKFKFKPASRLTPNE
jgi:hypothetical protein